MVPRKISDPVISTLTAVSRFGVVNNGLVLASADRYQTIALNLPETDTARIVVIRYSTHAIPTSEFIAV